MESSNVLLDESCNTFSAAFYQTAGDIFAKEVRSSSRNKVRVKRRRYESEIGAVRFYSIY